MNVSDLAFSPQSFDLIISLNVLQHIVDNTEFNKTVYEIVSVLKSSCHIILLEFSPQKSINSEYSKFLVIRSRRDYINVFGENGCKLIYEIGIPRIGVRLCRYTVQVGRFLKMLIFAESNRTTYTNKQINKVNKNSIKSKFENIVFKTILKFTKPFDASLSNFPKNFTDMRILFFQKK